ncbi:MAG: hypothetical protein PW786_05785 [Arachidicoccus sp.]|nr:hypothetical protein [Arachidicoccus sp.]
MKKILLLCLPFLIAVLAGCSSSKLTTSWVSPQAQNEGKHFNKVLVLGLLSNRNRAAKVNMETFLANDLKTIGVSAVTSTDLYGPMAFRNMSEKEAIRSLKGNDIDGIITITLIDKNSSRQFVPGYWGAYPFWGYYNFYGPYMWGGGGYYERTTSYYFETNLYDVENHGKLLYSAQSETVDPSSPEKLGNDFAKTIVNDLKYKNLIR